jgi:DNA-binding transcriptional ArsR family regulator
MTISNSTCAGLGNLFLALSDQTRLRLLSLMADGEVSVGFLAESLAESQPKISRHLAYLRSAGLVSHRRDGKRIYYAVTPQAEAGAENILQAVLDLIAGRPASSAPAFGAVPTTDHRLFDDTSVPADMNDWQPAEIDVFLL